MRLIFRYNVFEISRRIQKQCRRYLNVYDAFLNERSPSKEELATGMVHFTAGGVKTGRAKILVVGRITTVWLYYV